MSARASSFLQHGCGFKQLTRKIEVLADCLQVSLFKGRINRQVAEMLLLQEQAEHMHEWLTRAT
jgi:hypothetical protein